MLTSVTVVHGDGRVQVKVSPLMTLGEVCKQAMEQLNITSSAQYRLKHKRITLDPSMQIRFASSLPQNVCLDLVIHREDGTGNSIVKVVIQTPEGRLVSEHPMSRYIADVLLSLQTATSSFKVMKHSTTGNVLQLPVLNISGRNYHIEEWRGLRVCDVGDSSGLLMRVHWADTKLCESEVYSMLQVETPADREGVERSETPTDSLGSNSSPVTAATTDSPFQQIPQSSALGREYKIVELANTSTSSLNSEEVTFELSSQQAKQLVEDAKSRTRSLVDAPLVSKRAAMARQRAGTLTQYPSTLVRIRLPDKRILETSFNSTELGESIYSFVQQFHTDFDMLISAGRMVDPAVALVDQGLTPKAIVTVHNGRIVKL